MVDIGKIIVAPIMLLLIVLMGGLSHGLITTIIIFLIIFFGFNVSFMISLGISVLISGIINSLVNFRVSKESYVNFLRQLEVSKHMNLVKKHRLEGEHHSAISPPIYYKNKEYRAIELAKGLTKDTKKLTGFIILNEKDSSEINDKDKKEILGIYLFWRHIYFNPILGKINLTSLMKIHLKNYLKFQEQFKVMIEERKKEKYLGIKEDIRSILLDLDDEVYKQYPYVKKKTKMQLEIYDNLYELFTCPSDEICEKIMHLISQISQISQKENKYWCHRLKTWERLYKYHEIKISQLSNPNYKKISIGLLIDILKYIFKNKESAVSKETLGNIIVETSKIPRKKILKELNRKLGYHKFGIDSINHNIELNKSFKELNKLYISILSDPPIDKIRN